MKTTTLSFCLLRFSIQASADLKSAHIQRKANLKITIAPNRMKFKSCY